MSNKEKVIKSFLGNIEGWKSVLDSSPDLIAILDTEFKVVWVNKAMAVNLNVSPDSCLGLKCFEAVHGMQSPIPNCPHAKMISCGQEYTEEVNEGNLGGCFSVTASPVKDESGNVLGSIHIARDISERKKAAEKIQSLANVVESSDDAIITKSLEGTIISWNKGAEQIYGYSAEEVIGKSISILEPHEFSHETEKLIDKIKNGEKIDHYETLRLRKGNKPINVSIALSPVFDASGKLVAISTIARDITERKIAEKKNQKLLEEVQQFAEELEVSNEELHATTEELQITNEELRGTTEELQDANEKVQRFADIVESSDDAIITKSLEGNIIGWNRGAEEIYGYSAREILGSPISILEPPEFSHETETLIDKIKSGERVDHYETLRLKKGNVLINVSVTLSPVFNTAGELVAISAISRDITARKKVEEQNQKLLEEIQQFAEELEVSNEELQVTTEELQVSNEELQNTTEELHVSNEELKHQGEDLAYLNQELRESEQRVKLKLNSIISPEGDIGNLDLVDILDVQEVQSLMDNFYELNPIPMAIIDLKGDVLVGVGWQDICTKFHRVHPETCKHCIESDTQLSAGVPQGEFKLYKCKNNMWDIATPIIVGGKHMGNLFSGQFFFDDEQLDYDLFRKQAQKYDFNEEGYINALKAVPSLNREFVEESMVFFIKFADMISQRSYNNIKLARSLTEQKRVRAEKQNILEEMQKFTEELQVSNEELQNTTEELQVANEELRQQGDELLQFNQALQESEEKFLKAFHANPAAMTLSDVDGRYIDVNESYSRLTGYSRDELIGHTSAELNIINAEKRKQYLIELKEKRSEKDIEFEMQTKSGEKRIIISSSEVIELGSEIRNISFSYDLTERKQAEEALRESEERFRDLADNIPNLAWMADADGWIFWYNQQWYDYTGTTLEEMQGWGWQKVHHPDYVEPVTKEWSAHIKEGKPYDNIFPLKGKNGNYRWFLTRVTPILDENGKIQRWFGTNTDITERKEAEESNLWNQRRNELLAEVSSRLLTSENPQDVIDDLCQKTMEFMDCDVFFNYMADEQKERLHLNAYAGISEEEAQEIEWLDYGTAVCGCVALESRRVIAENIMETPDPRTDLVKSYGVQAYACHPLMIEGRSIGTLSFGTNSRTSFTDEELELMEAVADQISIAMNRLISNRALKESEESAVQARKEWEQTFEAVPDLIAILDTDYRVIRANKAMADRLGVTSGECIGLACYNVVHGIDAPPSFCPHQQLLEDGSEHTEEVHENRLGGDFLVSASPLHNSEGKLIGSVHVARDINERKKKEKELYQLNRAYRALSNSSQAMIRAKSEVEYLESVCNIVVEDCSHSMVWIGYAEADENKTVRPMAHAGFDEGYLETLDITWADNERGNGPTGTAIRTQKMSTCKNMLTDPKFKPWREEAVKRGYASSLVLPLIFEGKTLGAISIYSIEHDPFSEDEIKLLTELADNLAYGINVIRLRIAREQMEEALIRSENEFRTLAENSPDVIARFDRQNRHIYVNPAATEPYGLSQEDIIGKTHGEIEMDPEKTEFWERHHNKVFTTGKPETIEFKYKSPQGKKYYYNTQIVPEFVDGEVKSILAISRDITYIKEAEAELKEARDNLEEQVKERTLELEEAYESLKLANDYNRSLIEASIDPLVTIGPDGKITDVNYSTELATGYSREEIIGTDFSDYFTEPEKARKGYQEVFREGWVFDYPLEIKHKDGHTTPVLYNASVYKNEDGNVIGVFAAARDITEIKQAEDEIKRQAELLDLTHEAIIVRDIDGKILFWNDGAVKTYGWSMEEANGKITHLLLHTKFPTSLKDLNDELVGKGQWDGELVHTKSDGTKITVLSRQVLKKDENGNPVSILEINSDINERKKMEEELEFISKYNRSLIETSLDPLVTIGPDGKITDVNGATEAVTGYSRDELIGTDFSDYFTRPEKARDGYKQVFREGWVVDYPLEIKHKDGHITPVLYNASVYEDENGNVIGVFAAARDITELKRAEAEKQKLLERAQLIAEELEVSNEELQVTTEELQAANDELEFASKYNRSLIETSLDPLVTIGPDGKITDVNMATELVTGYYRDELIATDFSDYFTEPDKARKGYQEVFRIGQVFDYPLEIKHKEGHVTPVLYNASVYRNEDGEVIGVFAAARDITERKKAEEELEFAGKYNRSLIEASLDLLVTIGPDGKITDVNHSTEAVTGYARNELIGTDFSDYFTEPDKAREGYQHVFKENYVRDYPLEIQHKKGHVTPVLYNASVYRNEDGEVIGVFAAARDITERKKAEKLLKLKLEELARSNAELEQFAYVSSHDLQEPLRMIGSYLQLLQRRYQGELDDKADKYINFAVDGASRMQNLINDLLEFSRVTTRAREFEPTDCELVLNQVLSNLEVSINENKAVISHNHLPTIMADSTQLAQVFQNLISNAIKFRSEKVPKIYISAKKEDDKWIFSIADNGIGIDPKHSEKIFEVFKRLHKRREYPGTGIGLSICKKIIERHGGHIWVESEPGKGSVFYFTISGEGVMNGESDDI